MRTVRRHAVRRHAVHLVTTLTLLLPLLTACRSIEPEAPEVVPRDKVWECFRLLLPLDEKTKFLGTNNFGVDELRVLRARWLCEEAVKTKVGVPGPKPPEDPRVHECFDVRPPDGIEFPVHLYLLATPNFGAHLVETRFPRLVCEQAGKGETAAEAERLRPRRPRIHECYEIFGPDVDERKRLDTHNFGLDAEPSVRKARFLCEEAGMADSAEKAAELLPADPADVYECFDLVKSLDPMVWKFLSTSFGTHRVGVGRAEALCELAEKTYVEPPPPSEEEPEDEGR